MDLDEGPYEIDVEAVDRIEYPLRERITDTASYLQREYNIAEKTLWMGIGVATGYTLKEISDKHLG